MAMYRHRFAVFVSCCTFLLVIAGSLVTSTGSGLAVPDWPLSFGQLMPRMEGGVLFEHGHRMIAAAVGLLTVILALWTARAEDRRWVRILGWSMLGAVIVQGLLGGLTVLLKLPDAVSIAHAGLAQIFFGLTAIMAAVTAPDWRGGRSVEASKRRSVHSLARTAAAVVYLQIVLGAAVRHTGAALLIPDFPLSLGRVVPPLGSWPIALNFAHRVGAVLVLALVIALVIRTLRAGVLARPALLLAALTGAQITFGALTVLSGKQLVPTTLHVATGALVWVVAVIIATRSAPAAAPQHPPAEPAMARGIAA